MSRWIAGLGICLGLVSGSAWADVVRVSDHVVKITDVPSYLYWGGCGPTAAGMVIGYWDAHGYGNLIAGAGNTWAGNTANVKAMMASPGFMADYYNRTTSNPPTHANDCVADFMSASRAPLGYNESRENYQYLGLVGYANYRGYAGATGSYDYMGPLWNDFVAEINAGRPVEFSVDSDGNGSVDHAVTAYGYDDTLGQQQYFCYNTWDQNEHEYAFQGVGHAFGIEMGTIFNPAPEPATISMLVIGLGFLRMRGSIRAKG
jgi:hypothetical protein